MPLWLSNTAANTAAPKLVARPSHKANSYMNKTQYANTTVGAFSNGVLIVSQGANSSQTPTNGSHRGWQLKTTGTGPLLTAAVANGGGTGYTNGDILVATSPANSTNGGVNGSWTVGTNGSGVITSLTLVTGGKGFINATPAIAFTNSTGGSTSGTDASATFTAGGRAGRVHVETIVAAGSFTS